MAQCSRQIFIALALLVPVEALLLWMVSRIPEWLTFLVGLTGILGAVAIALSVGKFITSARYNPNADDEEGRIRRGREYAVLRVDLEKWLADQGQASPPESEAPALAADERIREAPR